MQRHACAEHNSIVMSAAVSAHWTMTGFGFVRDFSRMAGKFLIECATLAAAAALCCHCYSRDISTGAAGRREEQCPSRMQSRAANDPSVVTITEKAPAG